MQPLLSPTEHIEYLDDRLKLIVSPAHTFGTDALLLAAFALPGKNAVCCDFGTGCGIIPFYWLSKGVRNVSGVELQDAAASQLRRSIALSGAEKEFTFIHGDLREVKNSLPGERFDCVTMNPPYTEVGHGIESTAEADKISRHENGATLSEICRAAAYLLKFGGSFSICLRPERLTDAIFRMREVKIEPKRLRFVAKNASSAPWLFLLEGKKGRAPGLVVEPLLCMYDENGLLSREVLKITENYRK